MTGRSQAGRSAHFSLRFTPAAEETLEQLAAAAGVSRAEVLRRALAHFDACGRSPVPGRPGARP